MNRRANLKASGFLLLLLLALTIPTARGDFTIDEQLGRTWSNECVTFPAKEKPGDAKSLIDNEGKTIPYQLVNDSVCFQVDLKPYTTRRFKFSNKPAEIETDLKIEETDAEIRISNTFTGIGVRKKQKKGQGPIAGFKLRSGKWTGDSKFSGTCNWKTMVTMKGPVVAAVSCQAEFADKSTWTISFSLQAREPVVLVDETFDVPNGGTFTVSLRGKDYTPTSLLFRSGKGGNLGQVCSWKIAEKGTAFYLEPWLRWWMNERQGNWFALFSKDSADMLMVAALKPSSWKDPDWKGKAPQSYPCVNAVIENSCVNLKFPVKGGRRFWMIGTPEQAPSLKPLSEQNKRVSPLPQDYQIKHGDFPLNVIKDYVLEWDGSHDNYPRLFIRKKDLPQLQRRLATMPKKQLTWNRPISKYQLGGPIRAFIATGSPKLGMAIAKQATDWLQQCVNRFLDQDVQATLGMAPHMQTMINSAINLLDPVLATTHISSKERRRLLAKIAFLGYVVASDDYWAPRRGFRANPNMTTTVATYQTLIACMIPEHPCAKQWVSRGLRELRDVQLNSWSDKDGGWMEAPHYAMVSYDHILGAFLMAANAGLGEHAYDERMKKVMEWFACISTPRDPRTGGWRHVPPIGNTYIGERTGMFGIVAGLWKDRDPKFAAEMKWMHLEHGSFGPSGIGGFCPTIAGYRELLQNNDVKPAKPDCGSRWFQKTGVVLRNGFGTKRENYLHLIAGPNHDHYDYDSGSIVLWGKGALLASDFGYIGRHAPQFHSMLTSPAVSRGSIMKVDHFSSAPDLDFVGGVKKAWRRQILFAKDDDLQGPNFFVLRDTLSADRGATWKLWLTTKGIKIREHGATVEGEDDVDLDVFFYRPKDLKLKTESTVQKAFGSRYGKFAKLDLKQTALVAALSGKGAIVSVLFPRLKTQPSPKVTWLAEGCGVKVETESGTDYVFVSDKHFACKDGNVAFDGTAGAVKIRKVNVTLSLGDEGKVSAFGKELSSLTADSRVDKR